MITVTLYQFSKRKNSTKRPSTGTNYSCSLKDSCSLTKPVLSFDPGQQNVKANNYCYIPDFNRYYFISEWTFHNGIWTATCSIDVLGTYKDTISNYQGFVERASEGYNTLINDPYVSGVQNIANRSMTPLAIPNYSTDGCFVIRTTGKQYQSTDEFIGGVNTYAMTPANFEMLCANLFDVGASDIAAVITEEAVKAFFNPFQYILSIKWFPFPANTIGSETLLTAPTFGWFEGTGVARCVTDYYQVINAGTIARPTSIYDTDDFRAHSPSWTRYTLYLPGVGVIDVNPEDVVDDLDVNAVLDPITGEITYIIGSGSTKRHFTGQIGVDVQITQLATNPMGVISNTLGAAASAFSGNFIGASGSAVSAIQNALQPTQSVNGRQGSMALLKNKTRIELYCEQYQSATIPTAQYGRCCYRSTIIGSTWTAKNNLFLKLGAASMSDIRATDTEIVELNNMVNTGFYYE